MKFLSVCSGIEAASVAWYPLGWEAVAFSEIEPFPCAVLAHHYPNVPNWGDMTRFKEWPDAAIDVLVGGTPCQSFSVAGLRKGLDDPRGNLALTYLAILDRYRPRWCCWENVPGVLSSGGGRDFGAFLGGLGQLGYGFAYRVLDAQYFGLAQRRKRVFVVGHLGDWRRAAAVLFERESLSGHPAPSREAGQDVTGTLSSRTSAGGGLGTDFDVAGGLIADIAPTLNASFGKNLGLENQHIDGGAGMFIAHALRAEGFDASEDGTGRGTPIVAQPYTLAIRGRGDSHNLEYRQDGIANAVLTPNGGRGGIGVGAIAFSAKDHGADAGPLSPTLRAGGHDSSHANGGVMPAVAFDARQSDVLQYGDMSGPLDTDGHSVGVAYSIAPGNCQTTEGQDDIFVKRIDVGRTLDCTGADPSRKQGGTAVQTAMQVRRLTPLECCRLQGFPDDYLDIPYRGKPAADGNKYKALGNSMAVPCIRWLGERIALVDDI